MLLVSIIIVSLIIYYKTDVCSLYSTDNELFCISLPSETKHKYLARVLINLE